MVSDHRSVKRLLSEGKRGRQWNQYSDLKPEKRRTPVSHPCRRDRRLERCACRSHPPKRRRASLRASVSSDRSALCAAPVTFHGTKTLTTEPSGVPGDRLLCHKARPQMAVSQRSDAGNPDVFCRSLAGNAYGSLAGTNRIGRSPGPSGVRGNQGGTMRRLICRLLLPRNSQGSLVDNLGATTCGS